MQTALHALEEQAGARFIDVHGWQVPESFGDAAEEYRRLRRAAGIVDLGERGQLQVTGQDRVPYLHRMLSNEVQSLEPGQGNYCFLLDPQGHIRADMNLLAAAGRILLDTERLAVDKLRAELERFIIMDEVEVADVSAELGTIGVEGPLSREVVSAALGIEPPHMKACDHFPPRSDADTVLARISWTGEGFWLFAPAATCPVLWQRLVEEAARCGGGPAGLTALEIARVEAGIPRFGRDILATTLPQETGQFRALSFTKGCYPGQEIVERIRARGHVNRKLVGLTACAGQRLQAGGRISAAGKDIGELTTAVDSPGLMKNIALGYVRHEFAAPGTKVEAGGDQAEVSPLPFQRYW